MFAHAPRRKAPMPPLEGEVPNEREAEGFVRQQSMKTPQSARSGCQLPFQGRRGRFAPGGAAINSHHKIPRFGVQFRHRVG